MNWRQCSKSANQIIASRRVSGVSMFQVCARPNGMSSILLPKFESAKVARFLARLRRASVLVRSARTVSASPDEADNRFLECAEAAGVDFLVTGNKKHFPKRWKTTEVVNARELLGRIGSSFLK